ncbi:hypothetical protein [Methylobacterium sp. NEAU K]|uniref:hypothetical protein n=1 Tax=Methylobacterium sp. NEAU K TaxID=3064946 RepID=UPI002736317F|nr:hypothetical protein [Methylobacterium sp. NEAU K]MDP4003659.1 hypothetical protein [Methylobacterium sp. NEAU K]
MSNTPTSPVRLYPSFEDPPPRVACADALLGRVIRRLFVDASSNERGLAGTLEAILAVLDRRLNTPDERSR